MMPALCEFIRIWEVARPGELKSGPGSGYSFLGVQGGGLKCEEMPREEELFFRSGDVGTYTHARSKRGTRLQKGYRRVRRSQSRG